MAQSDIYSPRFRPQQTPRSESPSTTVSSFWFLIVDRIRRIRIRQFYGTISHSPWLCPFLNSKFLTCRRLLWRKRLQSTACWVSQGIFFLVVLPFCPVLAAIFPTRTYQRTTIVPPYTLLTKNSATRTFQINSSSTI